MRLVTRKKPAFMDLHNSGAFRELRAVRGDSGRWSLFGVWMWRGEQVGAYVEAARGGIREWSSLEHLADFCKSMDIEKFTVVQKGGR